MAVLSVALVFLVLAGEFASFTLPLLVMLTVPLAGAGGILVLWMTGQSLNAVSLIGMVVMIGIADNDAVVKLDAIRRFRELGHPLEEAVMLGGRQRLRAIAMTSLTTIVGVLPLVIGAGQRRRALSAARRRRHRRLHHGNAGDVLPAADGVRGGGEAGGTAEGRKGGRLGEALRRRSLLEPTVPPFRPASPST